MAKTAAELMAQAKLLMEQAAKIEEANALKIGKYVMTNIDKLTIADLKAYVRRTTGETVEPEKKDSKKPQVE